MNDLLAVQNQTKKYSEAYFVLSDTITAMERDIDAIKKEYMPAIKSGVTKLRSAGDNLYNTIDQNQVAFDKPKTQTFYNIRVGLMKGKGKKEFDNDVTVKLIKKHLTDQIDSLIKVEEKVIAKALEQLPASDLKKIAVEIVDSQDEIIMKPVDSEIQKIISKILSEINSKETEPVIVLGGK